MNIFDFFCMSNEIKFFCQRWIFRLISEIEDTVRPNAEKKFTMESFHSGNIDSVNIDDVQNSKEAE